jgi:hypothetical protein
MSPGPEFGITPVVSWPREVTAGRSYVVTVDLRPTDPDSDWPYDEEELVVGCMLDGRPVCAVRALGDPGVVLHRFGGTYGPARFVADCPPEYTAVAGAALWLTLTTGGGVPFYTGRLALDDSEARSAEPPIEEGPAILPPPVPDDPEPAPMSTKTTAHVPSAPSAEETPVVTVTMLGMPASGKTSFMIAMYGVMSAGVDGFSVSVHSGADPKKAFNEQVDLLNHWERLLSDGLYPPPTDARGFNYYEFVVNREFQPMVRVEWLDYRGAAVYDALVPEDTRLLVERLEKSDSVYIALDGALLGEWISELLQGGGRSAAIQQALGLNMVANLLLPAVIKREDLGLRPPSLVLLVTKEDLLVRASGLSRERAMQVVEAELISLLPIAYSDEVTLLVNPTTVESVGGGRGARCFLDPFLFTFVEYLRNSVTGSQDLIAAAQDAEDKNKMQMALLSQRLGGAGRLLHWRQIRHMHADLRQIVADAQRRKEAMEAMQRQASSLEGELVGLRIYDSGRPRRER